LISHYGASKAKVLGLGKTMAAKGSERGITVNLLAFGAFTALSGSMEDEEGSVRENELELNWFHLLFCGYLTKIINIMVKLSKWRQEESLRTSLVLTKATGIKILQ
jgi:NAD(P)-dependent dehydrogenase (short-subunit alcohol dehydrogenase family)